MNEAQKLIGQRVAAVIDGGVEVEGVIRGTTPVRAA